MSSGASTCCVFGIDCFVGDMEHAATLIVDRAKSGEGGYAALMNVHVAMTAQRNEQLRDALREAWVVLPDGAPISWLERRKGSHVARRVGGPDLMLDVLRLGGKALRHFFLGSTPEVLSKLDHRMSSIVPGLNVAGALAPPPGGEEDPGVIAEIRRSTADIVWVALGAPKQEIWASLHARALAPALVVGVGAAFDFHAGAKARAPVWMQHAGLEWLHRLITEPQRLGWRYLSTNSLFVLRALKEIAK